MLRLLKLIFAIYTPVCLGSDNIILNPSPNEDTTIQTYDGTSLLEHIRTNASNKTTELPLGVTSSNSVSTDQTIVSGKTLFKPNYILPGSSILTVDGALVTTGVTSGTGTIAGTGTVTSIDAGANGDDITFLGNVTVNGLLSASVIPSVADSTTPGLVQMNTGATTAVVGEYEEATVTGSSGDWTTTGFRIVRNGKQVTLSGINSWFVTDNTDTTQDTGAVIPESMRPATNLYYNYNVGAVVFRIIILTTGVVRYAGGGPGGTSIDASAFSWCL